MEAQEEPVWGQRQHADVRTGHGAGRTHNGSPALLTARTLQHACMCRTRAHTHTSHTHVTWHTDAGLPVLGVAEPSGSAVRDGDSDGGCPACDWAGEPVPWIRSQTCLACIPALPRGFGVTLHPPAPSPSLSFLF